MELLGFCLHNTYFSFQNRFYEQVEGAAMGSPISPIVANLYMEYFEGRALWSAANPPQVWYRFVDDTWVIQQQSSKQESLDHINSIDLAIKFTMEGTQGNGAIPFLDTLITPQVDNSLSITVYHKPPHTDQYFQWDRHHSLSAKYSVIGTLTHRTKIVYTTPELLQKEFTHLRNAMGKCNYPPAINKVQNKILNSNQVDQGNIQHNTNNTNQPQVNNNQETSTTTTSPGPTNTLGQVIIPYVQGTAKSFKHICGKYGIKVHFKGNTTIKQILMKPKDQGPMDKKSGVIYSYQCNNIACDEEYIGETARTLRERCKEHLKQPSPIHMHFQQTGYNITDTSFNIIGWEDQGQARTIKESIYIRVNNPTLNQNIGRYNLSHI